MIYALPCDMPGFNAFNPDAVVPRGSCADCGEWLIAGVCVNCLEQGAKQSRPSLPEQVQGADHRIAVAAEGGSIHNADSRKANDTRHLHTVDEGAAR